MSSFLGPPAGRPVPARADDDEGLFSRDINGQLLRLDAPAEADYEKTVTLQIDGEAVTVPLARPATDADGNIVLDVDGGTKPRYTTIYDAATELYLRRPSGAAEIPIPVLCHQTHMAPVAVCRLCVVQIYGQKRGKRAPERKLLPACQHQVREGMEVFTMNAPGADGERVRQASKVLTELLAADHLKPAPPPAPAAELATYNELQRMSDNFGLSGSRFKSNLMAAAAADPALSVGPGARRPALPPARRRGLDSSSPVFIVDHSACILCDRCSRACNDVKQNHVIGRTGKGADAGIGFDLNNPMGDSSCVRCGECMVSCPTTAISFKPVARVKIAPGVRDAEVMHSSELLADKDFRGIPPMFLLWQEGLVVRRRVKAGEMLCRQGDPGNTAFLLKSGRFEVVIWPQESKPPATSGPWLSGALLTVRGRPPREPAKRVIVGPEDVIVGEMACLGGTPRMADIAALTDGEVWELRRNVIDRLMRSPLQRPRFEGIYRRRALDDVLQSSDLFSGLPPQDLAQIVKFLSPDLKFVRVSPGQTIFRQDDWSEHFYLIRLGHVRVRVARPGSAATELYRGPGTVLGEIGLLGVSKDDLGTSAAALDAAMESALAAAGKDLSGALPAGRRTATCTALDHVELARLSRAHFLKMLRALPTVRRRLIELSLGRLGNDVDDRPMMREYIEQGLYQGRSLFLLDLTRCTQCGECVRACADQHGTESHGVPLTRLLLDGKRFGDYLVARSCRSCKDAYCMIGCPVDSIHRGRHMQIVIEDHCIGCGLCAENCPYDNIFMLPNLLTPTEVDASGSQASGTENTSDASRPVARAVQPKAATCDLCDADGDRPEPLPRCVYACPHDAAHRMSGDDLLQKIADAATAAKY